MESADEGYSEAPLNTSFSKSADGSLVASSGRRELSNVLLRHITDLSLASKTQLALTLLDHLPTSVIADIVAQMSPRLYIDFVLYLPTEICLKILGYLDPLSLIRVAKACRTWYDLALDRKLWERVYYREGWRAIPSEMLAWEERVNASTPPAAPFGGHLQRFKSSDDGHTHKKRSVEAPASTAAVDGDSDYVMIDAGRALKQEPADIEMGEGPSLFAGASSSAASRTCVTPGLGAMNMDGSASSYDSRPDVKGKGVDKGKGKAVAATSLPREPSSAGAIAAGVRPESLPDPTDPPGSLGRSTLWLWDSTSGRYRINWKYLYSARHRLEDNWDRGRFSCFQFPHPDHPEEGHDECIYTLQFNTEFLVSGSRDRTIRIWDMKTRRLVRAPLTAHNGSVLCLQFDSDPEEDIIVSGSSDSDVIVWKFSTGQMVQRLARAHGESVLNVKFDKRILVTCSKDKTIKIFNRRPLHPGDKGYDAGGATFYPAGTRLIKNYGGGMDSPLDQLPVKPPFTMIGALIGHGAAVNAVQIVGDEVVSASGDRNLKIWDWPTQHCRRTFLGHSKGIACVQYDGKRIVSGSSDNEVKVFDRQSGVEVARLRAHTDLVRTVQAGFADLPYSDHEDREEAKRLDQLWFDTVGPAAFQRGGPRSDVAGHIRNRDTPSRRREHVTAFGAELPPGGGGGRFARIVSGSYDQSIIIWKRDKEGVWKKHHHLKQEDAAEIAARERSVPAPASSATSRPVVHRNIADAAQQQPQPQPQQPQQSLAQLQTSTDLGDETLSALRVQRFLESTRQAQQSSSSTSSTGAVAGSSSASAAATDSVGVDGTSSTTAYPSGTTLVQIINYLVPQGVLALQQALAANPALLAMQPQLQAAIDREQSPLLRSQLRQAVSTALVRTQLAQSRSAQRQHLAAIHSRNAAAIAAARSSRAGIINNDGNGSSSSQQADATAPAPAAGPSASSSIPVPLHSSGHLRPSTTTANSAPAVLTNAAAGGAPAAAVASSSTATPAPSATTTAAVPPSLQQHDTGLPQPDHPPTSNPTATAAAPATTAPAAAVAGGPPPAPAQAPAQPAHHHPHIQNNEASTPVRIFKLQFDVRRIICCSQTHTIVGWDFCAGDPELEEASRFFGTIE